MELAGKTILITGSTDGLGKLVAMHAAQRGAFVILHGRNDRKGAAAADEIINESRNDHLKYYNADFGSLEEVKLLGEKILKNHSRIDILVNNTGIGKGKHNHRELSRDGFELRFAVNYLAHVLLTEILVPVVSRENARIVNVASVGQAPLDFSNLMLEKKYDGFLAYQQSKTALIMYTFDLAARLKSTGTKVNAVHPASLMATNMALKDWGYALSTVEDGARSVENLFDADATGLYFDMEKAAKAIPQAYDEWARAKLRDVTEEILEKFGPVMVY
jgi:NAD(P)-dependent dehydrogenase (short-subunit alcohol dehydrogenase family)